jgi:hypothetical protein
MLTTEPTTESVLKGMLVERIGKSMLDSGCAYGYNYEHNRGVDLDAEPETTLDFRYGIEVTHNVYPWLKERLEFDPEMDALFYEFIEKDDPGERRGYYELEEAFPAYLKKLGRDVGGIYGDGDAFVENTYNGEDLLSQVLQYLYFEVDGDAYVLLQIHGGCDVRGGYTDPRAFRVKNDGTEIFDNARATIVCENHGKTMLEVLRRIPDPNQLALFSEDEIAVDPELLKPIEHYWDSDNGYNWHFAEWSAKANDLRDYEILRWDEDEETPIPGTPQTGVIAVDTDGNGYCPICGGLLKAWSR